MESNWWVENNGTLSPITNLSVTNTPLLSSAANHNLPRNWIPNIPFAQSSIAPLVYESNILPGLQSATVDTFIQSFTQRLQLTESVPCAAYTANPLSTHQYLDNSIQTLANYRAFTQYYNSRRIDVNSVLLPLTNSTNRNLYPNTSSSLLSLNNMQHLSFLFPPHQTASAATSTQQLMQQHINENIENRATFDYQSSVRFINQQSKDFFCHPSWKNVSDHFYKSTANNNIQHNHTAKINEKVDDFQREIGSNILPSSASSKLFSSDIWNNSKSTSSNSSSESDSSLTTADESDDDRLLANSAHYQSPYYQLNPTKFEDNQKYNDNLFSSSKSYLNYHFNYTDPYGCEFCKISQNTNNSASEIHQQKLLIHLFELDPCELTNAIKVILTSKGYEEAKKNVKDSINFGLTAFYIDEHKRKMRDLFPNLDDNFLRKKNNNFLIGQRNCIIRGCNCHQFVTSHEITLTIDQTESLKSNSEELFKLKTNAKQKNVVRKMGSNVFGNLFDEEHKRNRMAEFVCIGPLNNNWYKELLEYFWSRSRPRLPYTQNFVYSNTNDENGSNSTVVYNSNTERLTREKLHEILMKRVHLKLGNEILI